MTAWVPDRGDVIWLDFSSHAGHEQAGRRPALVLTPQSYNGKVGLALICPITSRGKGYPFEVPLPAGLKTRGFVQADQVKSQDWKSRKTRRADRVPGDFVAEVIARLDALLALS